MHWTISVGIGRFWQKWDSFFPSLAQLPNCGSASRQVWPLTDKLALAKMTEINQKKGVMFVVCAELGTASGLPEHPDMVDETGCECQGWAEAGGSFRVGGHCPGAAGSGAGVRVGFDVQRAAYGSRQDSLWSNLATVLGMHTCIFRAVYCNMCKFIRAC